MKVIRVMRVPQTGHPSTVQPACADCERVVPLILGIATSRGDRVPLCPACAAELADAILQEAGLP